MKYKVLEKQDIPFMKYFVDDQNTQYTEDALNAFLDDPTACGFVAKEDDTIVGFAYGYVLRKPDGKKDFYLHAIDILAKDQKQGYGTELMKYINAQIKKLGCRKMFLITNKSNLSACRCYEKSRGISKASDEIVYVYQ